MDDQTAQTSRELSHQEISGAVTGLGWRLVLGAACACIRVGSLAQAASVAGTWPTPRKAQVPGAT
jgi:hypothetical protein